MQTPGLEFEHFLAEHLSMTVDEMRARVSNIEFVRWSMYYARKAQRAQVRRR